MKKRVVLFVVLMVAMMCVGCTSPDSRESSLEMDKNGKGTFSTKFGFDKSFFEQSKYGTKKSMTEYVETFKNSMPTDLGIQFETDTSSDSKYSYVTVSIAFDSVEDLNKKAKTILNETDKICNNGANEESFYDFSEEIYDAALGDAVDQVFQEYLKKNDVKYDVNADQYKALKIALATGIDVDSVNELEEAKVCMKNIISYYDLARSTYCDEEVITISLKDDGEYLEMPPYLVNMFENYMFNLVLVNKDKYINYDVISEIAKPEIEKLVVEQIHNTFKNDKLIDYLKNSLKGDLSCLSARNLGEDLYNFGINDDSYELPVDYVKALKKVLTNGQNRECDNKFSVRYGDVYVEDVFENDQVVDGDTVRIKISNNKGEVDSTKVDKNSNNKAYDDTPKTGDRLPLEILFVLMLVSAVVTCGCFVYYKKAR